MINKSLKLGSLMLLGSLALSLCAQAGQDYSKSSKNPIVEPVQEPRFFISLSAGGEFDIHATKFISNGGGDFGAGGVITLPTKIQSRDFSATHDPVINGKLEVGYIVSPYLSLFTGFTYSHANGNDSRKVGSVRDPVGLFGAAGGVYDLIADVEDYNAYSGLAGAKLTLPRFALDAIHAPRALTPYISVSAGGKYVEATQVRFFNGGGNRFLSTRDFAIYDDSWVFTSQANLGLDYQITRNFSLVTESGFGYDTKLDRGSKPAGLNGVNRGGDRFYNTVSLGGKVTF
jgi:hypothetical protein